MTRNTPADRAGPSESPDATDATDDESTRPPGDAESTAAFDAVLAAKPLRTALDAASVLVDECILQATTDGLRIVATDPATVGIVSLSLPTEAFERYETAGARLGIDLSRLSAVVGMAKGDDPVRLSLDAGSRTLAVRVGELAYTLALIDPEAIRSLPDVVDFSEHFVATVGVEGAAFSRGVDAAEMVSNHVTIGVEDGGTDDGGESPRRLYLRADGDTDSVDYELRETDCETFEGSEARSLFSLSYLSDVNRVVPAGRPVRIRLGEAETPMELAFDVADGDGRVRYVLAPRISSR